MPCFIRNPNTEPVTLPTPFRGILGRGQGIMVNVSASLALTLLGGVSFQAGSLDVRDEPAYVGSYDSFFLDPSAIVPAVLSARFATTANDTLSGLAARDGVTPAAGDIALAKDQSTASQNGLWVAATGAWTRSSLMPAGGTVAGRIVVVAEGTVSADTSYTCTNNPGADIVGTSNLVFAAGSGGDALLVHKAGAETITGAKTFSDATSPIITAKIGPTSGQQHTLPAVASDTVALLREAQELLNKTFAVDNAAANDVRSAALIKRTVTGGAFGAAGVGASLSVSAESTTGVDTLAGSFEASLAVATEGATEGRADMRGAYLGARAGAGFGVRAEAAALVRGVDCVPGVSSSNAQLVGVGEAGAGIDFRADPNGTVGALRFRNPGNTGTIFSIEAVPSGAGQVAVAAAAAFPAGASTVTANGVIGQITFANATAWDTAVTVNNTHVAPTAIIFATVLTADSTFTMVKVSGVIAGQFVLTGNAACTAPVQVAFLVINPAG